MEKFKVVITSSEASMWYKDLIGEVFTVAEPPTPHIYYQYTGNKIIFKSDCKITK